MCIRDRCHTAWCLLKRHPSSCVALRKALKGCHHWYLEQGQDKTKISPHLTDWYYFWIIPNQLMWRLETEGTEKGSATWPFSNLVRRYWSITEGMREAEGRAQHLLFPQLARMESTFGNLLSTLKNYFPEERRTALWTSSLVREKPKRKRLMIVDRWRITFLIPRPTWLSTMYVVPSLPTPGIRVRIFVDSCVPKCLYNYLFITVNFLPGQKLLSKL